MEHILEQLERGIQSDRYITTAEYREWQRGYIFDGMRDLRYGHRYIRETYVR